MFFTSSTIFFSFFQPDKYIPLLNRVRSQPNPACYNHAKNNRHIENIATKRFIIEQADLQDAIGKPFDKLVELVPMKWEKLYMH